MKKVALPVIVTEASNLVDEADANRTAGRPLTTAAL
jgi:hypothetical protein